MTQQPTDPQSPTYDPTTFDPLAVVKGYAASAPNAPALTGGEHTLTYAELYRRILMVANGLQAIGVKEGDRVGYVGRNWPEFFEVALACARIGAVMAPFNWRLTPSDVAELATDAGVRIVVTDAEFAPAAPRADLHLTIGENYEAWRDRWPAAEPDRVSRPEDHFIQFYTSGTTGLPKGVVVRNRNFGYLNQCAAGWRMDADATVAVVMPLFHMGGSAWAFVGLFSGAHCVLFTEFAPVPLLEAIERDRISTILVAPAMLQMMLDTPGATERDYSSLDLIAYGAAPITGPLLRQSLATFDAPLLQMFGLTETTGCIVQLEPDDHHDHLLTSVGRPLPWVEVEIRDADQRPLGAGEFGEIWIRSGQCAEEYWRRPEATAELRPGDGAWLRTGDAGHLDADGYLFITDRIKDMIITGGENVYPAEVERVLVDHPFVQEVAVIGTPHDVWGEAVTAIVVVRDGHTLTEDELVEWARPRIAGFRRPRRVEFMDLLPRNPSGKVLKHEIRRPYWEGRDRTI
ncbi:long-chain-fatty-acid--CoA ligase [Nocardia rhizosphaerihabitans]|uniref:Acyl-CoA synthetase n=1 Tax=Nocardia rhizosphaerihabitans TaxID=1691570 RepID=A0ABQ2KGJ0_9NOCA|nr:long-chain-fatty-acid--CoA ligase [Nocardia rhizosphaerihabitans]GGN80601.1 acyl-CoA synthetase [Nocardia rhizosphaerihabitans]